MKRLQHLYLTYSSEIHTSIQAGTHPTHSDERFPYFTQAGIASCSQWWKTSIQAGTHPTHSDEIFPYFHLGWNSILLTLIEYFCTYIHPGGNTSYSQWWNISIVSSRLESHPSHNDGKALHLHLTWYEPNPTPLSEGHVLTSELVGTKSYTLIRMAPSPRLSYLVMDQVPPLSWRVAVALTSVLLDRMANTHIWHGRNLIL